MFGCCMASAFEKYNVSHLNFVHSVLFLFGLFYVCYKILTVFLYFSSFT